MPDWKREIGRRLRAVGAEPAGAAGIVDELAQHLDDRYRELREGGATDADAARTVLAELGECDWLTAEVRRAGRRAAAGPIAPGTGTNGVAADLWLDLRYAFRALRGQPVFAAAAVLALALGIGGNTAIFSLVNAILLRPLPFPQPERLVWVTSRRAEPGPFGFNLPDFIDFRDQNRTLAGIAAFASWSANLTDQGDPERVQGLRLSANAFQVLGVEALVGRTLLPEEDAPGRQHVVVLGHGLWRRRFGGDPGIAGKTVRLNGVPYTVVGVLPPQFFFPLPDTELAVPLAPDADPWRDVRTSVNFLRAVARLKPGVTPGQAGADLTAVAQRIRRQHPVANAQKLGVSIKPLDEEVVGHFRLALWLLLGAVAAVLLITCVNLANLMLVRASSRRREIAIRTALGATPGRIVRQVATECLLVAALGGAAGMLLAWHGIDALVASGPAGLPRAAEVGVDGRVLGFTLSLSLLSACLFGLAPAWQATRVNLNDELKDGGRGAGGPRRSRTRHLLVVSEIALSFVLLAVAGVLVRSFLRLHAVHPGFATDHVLAVRLSLPKARYPDRAAATAFYEDLKGRLEGLPGVRSVGVVSALPLSGVLASIPFTIEGRATPPDEAPRADFRLASPGYFRALSIPVLAGREFDERDTATTPAVALVSRSLARRHWPDGDPLGATLQIDDNDRGPRPVEIVGVVGDVRHQALDGDPAPHIYLPIRQTHEDGAIWLTNNQFWLLRTEVVPESLSVVVRRQIRAVDPEVPASNIRTMEQYLDASVAPRRFTLRLLMVFAAAALALAGTGLYGVVAYGVAQRRREIGIRVALGARAADVMRLVIGQGLTMTLAGVVLGVAAALGLTRLIRNLLFDVDPADPPTYLVTALVLVSVALLACWVPARRAMRVDPIVALREE